jgi:DmsE family decaheme c-type cytochrome
MPNTNSSLRRNCLLLAVAAQFLFPAALLSADAKAKAAGKDKAGASAKAPAKFGDEYVGSETCQACHEDIYNNFLKSPHKAPETDKTSAWQKHGCESCHGAGAKHAGSASAEDIRNPAKLVASQTDRICLGCHLNQTTHAGRIQSSHMKDSVSCVACHTVHAKGPVGLVPRSPEEVNQLCASCHINVMAQFQKPYRHKLPENAMTCVDCHNPHGSTRPSSFNTMGQSFAANEPGCIKCHGDKRGPFTFEHAPVRFEGCPTCHEAHGSVNPRMLVRHEVRLVCLECHSNIPATKNAVAGVVPPGFHDLRLPQYQNCTVCHQKVHGSYTDRNLLK